MTREKEINVAASKYIEDNSMPDGEVAISDHKDSFIEGAEWADSNPKSPWISVEDDLPHRHFELLEPIPTENFKGETISVLVIDNKGYSWFDYMVLYKNIWKWKYLESDPSYWMQIPELPKE